MKSFPKYPAPFWAIDQIRRSTGLIEDVCHHGVGHPNHHWLMDNDPDGKKVFDVHGCCGCCVSKEELVVMRKTELIERLEKVKAELESLESETKQSMKGYCGRAVELAWEAVCLAVDLVSVSEESKWA